MKSDFFSKLSLMERRLPTEMMEQLSPVAILTSLEKYRITIQV